MSSTRRIRRARLALMAQWIAKRSPFVRRSDLTRGKVADMARAPVGRFESFRFIESPLLPG